MTPIVPVPISHEGCFVREGLCSSWAVHCQFHPNLVRQDQEETF